MLDVLYLTEGYRSKMHLYAIVYTTLCSVLKVEDFTGVQKPVRIKSVLDTVHHANRGWSQLLPQGLLFPHADAVLALLSWLVQVLGGCSIGYCTVQDPSMSMARPTMSWTTFSTRSLSTGSCRSYMILEWKLPSPMCPRMLAKMPRSFRSFLECSELVSRATNLSSFCA